MRWQILYQTLASPTKYAGEKYSLKGLSIVIVFIISLYDGEILTYLSKIHVTGIARTGVSSHATVFPIDRRAEFLLK